MNLADLKAPFPIDGITMSKFLAQIKIGDPLVCWPWQGAKNKARNYEEEGYGRFHFDGGEMKAHRFMYLSFFGPVNEGHVIRHKCDNPACVNPAHLESGTVQDNVRDKYERGRAPNRAGTNHPLVKIGENDVHEIRRLSSMGWKQRRLSEKYGISRAQIYRITERKAWSHI